MSRSYKRFPCWSAPNSNNGVHGYVHYAKQFANQKVRRPWHWDIASGGAYKKITDSWDIRDYKCVYYTRNQVLKEIERAKVQLATKQKTRYRDYYKKQTLLYYYYAK